MNDSRRHSVRRPVAMIQLMLLAVVGGIFLLVPGSSAAATCLGEKVTIYSNADRIMGRNGHDVIQGGPGKNFIDGGRGNDRICGGGGDDYIVGYRGNDRADGEGGDDTVHGDRGSDPMLDGGGGSDKVIGGSGNDDVYGGPGDQDFVNEGFGDGRADGGSGDRDVVLGDIGIDRMDGGPGQSDIASFKSISQPLYIDLGAGRVSGAESERLRGFEDVIGGSGNDTIQGSGDVNRLDGNSGDDRLIAAGGGDRAYGGAGSNECQGAFVQRNSCGRASGQEGTAVSLFESIDGSGNLVIDGNGSTDDLSLDFGGGDYSVRRSGGNQIRLGNTQSDSCRDTGAGVTCSGRVTAVTISLDGGDDTVRIGNLPRQIGATIEGGSGSDNIEGGPNDDVIASGDDRVGDRLSGGGGDDALFGVNIEHPRRDSGSAVMVGGPGDDLLIGGQPCNGDLFDGGPGTNDSASFARVRNSGIRVIAEIGGRVSDPNIGRCNEGRITSSVEKIEGSKGPDILFGDNSGNTLLGMGGNDRLNGRGGFDKCSGGGGRDRVQNCEKGPDD